MENLIVPIVALGGLGIFFGVGLALASKKFRVATDPRLEKVFTLLPGVNCGACGKAGCMGFAEGLIHGSCSVEQCTVSTEAARHDIAVILGIEVKKRIKNAAVLHCHGGTKRVQDSFVYSGVQDCIAANLVMGGQKACVYGCLGFGTCVRVCTFGALSMNEEGLPVVNESRCTSCGKCVAACPKGLFSIEAATKVYAVRCKSKEFGKKVMGVCSVGCIGCKKCEKACPTGAMKVIDNLAVIDYKTCDNRGACFQACPTKAIAKKEKGVWISR